MFQLTKVWIDPEPGIETVEIRYTWSPLGEPAKWDGREEAVVMAVLPNTDPKVRQGVLEIPRYLNDAETYQLHYQFVIARQHSETSSTLFSEAIVARDVSYTDHEGRITEMRLLWSVGGWHAPNWTQATLEGLNLQTDPGRAGHDREGEGIADDMIYELIQTVSLPRRYVGKVWGPQGGTVEYVYQLLRTGSPLPEDDFATWDNNQAQNYRLQLT